MDRFWSKVDKRSDGECWPWLGGTSRKGYGRFRVGSRTDGSTRKVQAHRMAFELSGGVVPPGLFVLHRCDNPCCCNPGHLRVGTHLENMAEMRARGRRVGRSRRGEDVCHAKLNERSVRRIRALAASTTKAALARRYRVSEATIFAVVKRQTWAHVQ